MAHFQTCWPTRNERTLLYFFFSVVWGPPQIERTVLFFLEQQGQLAAHLQKLQEEQQALTPADLALRSADLMEDYRYTRAVLLLLFLL